MIEMRWGDGLRNRREREVDRIRDMRGMRDMRGKGKEEEIKGR
jgi:hypothetical protein